jgi:zinc transport system permease protein
MKGRCDVFEVLGYEFFRNALMAGIFASIACGVIGSYVVVKKMVSVSGGISHAAFGGIGLGYFLGFDPIIGAIIFTLGVSLGIGTLQQKARQNLDTLVGAVWASGMALGIIFIALTPGYAPDLFSFLFGNILLVPSGDIVLMAVLVAIILAIVALLYYPLLAVTFDEEYARVMNLPVVFLSYLLLTLVALTVVMLIRVVGIILVIALLALPPAIAREWTGNLKSMMALSTLLGAVFTLGGIWLSYIFDIPSGATIIIVCASAYLLALAGKKVVDNRSFIPS